MNNLPKGWKVHIYMEKYQNENSLCLWYSSLCGLVKSDETTKKSDLKSVNCQRCLDVLNKARLGNENMVGG